MSKRNIRANSGKQLYLNNRFNKGMLYTSGEINEGYTKILDNLDVTPSGDAVSPRPPVLLTPSKQVRSRYTYPVVFQNIPDKQCYVNFPYTVSELDYINDKLQDNFDYNHASTFDQIQVITRDNNALNNTFEFDAESTNPDYNPDLELGVRIERYPDRLYIQNYNEEVYIVLPSVSINLSEYDKQTINTFDVTDADTATINDIKYRFANINAPEKHYKWYTYGKNFLCKLLEYLQQNDYHIFIRTYGIDTYDRHIADIFIGLRSVYENIAVSINHIILKFGLAKLDYVNNEYKYISLLNECYEYAIQNKMNMWNPDTHDPYFKGTSKAVTFSMYDEQSNSDEYPNVVLEVVKIESNKPINYTTENIVDKVEFQYVDYNDSIVFIGRLVNADDNSIIYKGPIYLQCKIIDDITYFVITTPEGFEGDKPNIVSASTEGYNLLNTNVIDTNNVKDTHRPLGCDGLVVLDPNNSQRVITQSILGNTIQLRAIMNESWYNHGFNIVDGNTNELGIDINYNIKERRLYPFLKPGIDVNNNLYVRLFNDIVISTPKIAEESYICIAKIIVNDTTRYVNMTNDHIYVPTDNGTKILYNISKQYDEDDYCVLLPNSNDSGILLLETGIAATSAQLVLNNNDNVTLNLVNNMAYIKSDKSENIYLSESNTSSIINNMTYILHTPKDDKIIAQISFTINYLDIIYRNYNTDKHYKIYPTSNASTQIYNNNYTNADPLETDIDTNLGHIKLYATTTINDSTSGIIYTEIRLNTENIKLSVTDQSNIQLRFKWGVATYGSDHFTDITDYTTLYKLTDFTSTSYERLNNVNIDKYNYIINTNSNLVFKYSMLPVLHINDDIEISYDTQESYIIYPKFTIGTFVDYIDNEELTKNLNIKLATRVTLYNRQVGLYGPYLRTNTIFFSKFEEPFYFSYPYYAVDIEDKLLYAYVWNDNLVIFGRDNIWLLVTDGTINNSTVHKIYDELSISDTDRDLVKTVGSNLIFFNNNNGYIMTSSKYYNDPTNVSVYKLTENINNCLSNPEYIFRTLANIPVATSIQKITCRYKLYIDNQYINIVCNLSTPDIKVGHRRLILIYRYNQLYKYWSTYSVLNDNIDIVTSSYISEPNFGNQYIVYNEEDSNIQIMYFDQSLSNKLDFGKQNIITTIDTGFISVDPLNDKRFKDVIIDFNNISRYSDIGKTKHTLLNIYANFFIDGSPVLLTDDNTSMDFEYEGDEPLEFKEGNYIFNWVGNIESDATYLPEFNNKPYGIQLPYGDGSINSYGRNNLRIPVFGKGRLPSLTLKISSDQNYEIVGYSIIYKEKNINRRR